MTKTLRRLGLLFLFLSVLAALGAAPAAPLDASAGAGPPVGTPRRARRFRFPVAPRAGAAARPTADSASGDDECLRARHVLNRLGFGPRPGDVERVLAAGIPAWIEQQLYPERLADPDSDARLEALPTTRMGEAELLLGFDRPERDARRFLEKERSRDSAVSAMAAAAAAAGIAISGPAAGDVSADDARKVFQARLQEIVNPSRRPQRVLEELTEARITRAVFSERQLNEVMVDFWMNHFNVFAGKDTDRILIASFENEVVRPRIWSCFRELLLATARSPAMLVYLDNAQSVADSEHRPGAPPAPAAPQTGKPSPGINENYARELLELHGLGVDGGYSQLDVTELARILTGWAYAPPEEGGGFQFRSQLHDVCAKTLLGHPFSAGGFLSEGEAAIDLIARHPSTARHISFELCQRLVADVPPPALVSRVAARFLETDGDLRETVRAVVTSPEFFDPKFRATKVKSPFEYVVSALRVTAAQPGPGAGVSLARQIADSGEPLYLCAPPTGYPETGAPWVSAGTLLARLNFAVALTSNRVEAERVDLARLLPPAARPGTANAAGAGSTASTASAATVASAASPDSRIRALELALLGGEITDSTRRRIRECVLELDGVAIEGGEAGRLALAAGDLLGSPEFQRR